LLLGAAKGVKYMKINTDLSLWHYLHLQLGGYSVGGEEANEVMIAFGNGLAHDHVVGRAIVLAQRVAYFHPMRAMIPEQYQQAVQDWCERAEDIGGNLDGGGIPVTALLSTCTDPQLSVLVFIGCTDNRPEHSGWTLTEGS
jgi:hypothetical protein